MKVNVVFQDIDDREVYYLTKLELDQLKNKEELQELYNDERLANNDFEFSNWLDKLVKTKQIKNYKVLDTWLINY